MFEPEKQYLHVQLISVSDELEDIVSSLCFEFGASGVSEELSFAQENDKYLPSIEQTASHTLNVFFEKWPDEDFFQAVLAISSDIKIDRRIEDNKDWMEEWKKGFKPFPLVGTTWIVPSWFEKPSEAEKAIYIDPGMAFGTGTHATTQLASEILVARQSELPKDFTAIDVGCGTGVLAILLEQLGASVVEATEIDDDARQVAKENTIKNQCENVHIVDQQIESLTAVFDVVVANIIDGVLLELRDHLLRCLKPGGLLVLTGILEEREAQFKQRFFEGLDTSELQREQKSEWVGLSWRRSQ